MYKLLIADDEKIIREGLLKMVNWNKLGFEVVKTISDGEEVIDFLESELVDVVLTDVMMPHVSGIDIAKYVQEYQLPCKVVFISGYKKFEFAHQAIKYGVEYYILKPSKMEEVVAVFEHIRNELDCKAADMKEKEKLREQWEEMQPVLAEKFISSLILSGELTDKADIERRMQLLYPEVDSKKTPCVLATLKIEDYEQYLCDRWNYSAEQLDDMIYNFVKIPRETGYFHIVYKFRDNIRIFVISKLGADERETKEVICTQVLDDFITQLRDIFQLYVSLQIEQVYEQIYQVVDFRKDLFREPGQYSMELQFLEQKKLIMTNVISGSFGTAHKILINILQDNISNDVYYQKHIFIDILSVVMKLLQEHSEQLYQSIEPFVNYQQILTMDSGDELIQYCDRLFERMRQYEGMDEVSDKQGIVNRVKKYVSDHIYEDVILEDIANEMFITTTHLRRIIKKQTGETFLQYVTRKKMEKAAMLLHDPRYKVYQVGSMLGYNTPRYFSKMFYSFYGCYPQQYRKDVLKLGDQSNETE